MSCNRIRIVVYGDLATGDTFRHKILTSRDLTIAIAIAIARYLQYFVCLAIHRSSSESFFHRSNPRLQLNLGLRTVVRPDPHTLDLGFNPFKIYVGDPSPSMKDGRNSDTNLSSYILEIPQVDDEIMIKILSNNESK